MAASRSCASTATKRAGGPRSGPSTSALPLLEPGKSLRFALLPEGQDPDDLARSGGAAAIARVLDGASPLVDMLWSREVEAGPLDTPERRAVLEQAACARCVGHPGRGPAQALPGRDGRAAAPALAARRRRRRGRPAGRAAGRPATGLRGGRGGGRGRDPRRQGGYSGEPVKASESLRAQRALRQGALRARRARR